LRQSLSQPLIHQSILISITGCDRWVNGCGDDIVRQFINQGILPMNNLVRLLKDESGVTAIEYGLIAAFIAVVLITVLPGLSTNLGGVFTQISTALAGGGGS
jgi:pilus assembly protein Flp/PilA